MSDERLHSQKASPWLGEHLHRYQVAVSHLQSTDKVLDIATGEGYGAAMLAKAVPQGEVTGADAERASVTNANMLYKKVANLNFVEADATKLAFEDNTFDKIISFETLEHVKDYNKMLSELNRVLKPDGLLLLSTPNFPINSPKGVLHNPYHVKEFTLKEMAQIMPAYFSNVQILGQEYQRYQKKKGLGAAIAKGLEGLFYTKGIRKLPIGFRDFWMKLFISKPLYPETNDYGIVHEPKRINNCKTFFVTAQKNA